MRGIAGGSAAAATEEVAGAATSDVDTIVPCQAQIIDFRAAVIERQSPPPSNLGQLLLAEGGSHGHVFGDGHN